MIDAQGGAGIWIIRSLTESLRYPIQEALGGKNGTHVEECE
jgi:hypothetical protein